MKPGDHIKILLSDDRLELSGKLVEMNHEGVIFADKKEEVTFIPHWNIQAVEQYKK